MKPVKFKQVNADSVGTFIDDNNGPLETIPVYVGFANIEGKERKIIISAWKPSKKELADLNNGKSIFLAHLDVHVMPTIGFTTDSPFEEISQPKKIKK